MRKGKPISYRAPAITCTILDTHTHTRRYISHRSIVRWVLLPFGICRNQDSELKEFSKVPINNIDQVMAAPLLKETKNNRKNQWLLIAMKISQTIPWSFDGPWSGSFCVSSQHSVTLTSLLFSECTRDFLPSAAWHSLFPTASTPLFLPLCTDASWSSFRSHCPLGHSFSLP